MSPSNLATVTDSVTGVVTTYYYDLLNRQSGYRELGENYDHSVTYIYDDENNLSSMTETINGATKKDKGTVLPSPKSLGIFQ